MYNRNEYSQFENEKFCLVKGQLPLVSQIARKRYFPEADWPKDNIFLVVAKCEGKKELGYVLLKQDEMVACASQLLNHVK